MRFAKVDSKYYCGIDLHSRSMYISVMDKEGEILFHRNMPNDFDIFKNYVERFRPNMAVGVESSCYYYWLADACKEADIPFYLGHAYYMKAINIDLEPKIVKDKKARNQLLKLFDDKELQMMISLDLLFIEFLDPIIAQLERHIREKAKHHNHLDYQLLRSIPGVGEILSLIILYETHDTARFKKVQRYSSYCGVVKCERESVGKKIAAKNTKIRNPYLKWAFGEIILKAQVAEPKIAKLYNRLKAKYGLGRAKSIIAHRFAVATYFMLKNKQAFDVERFVQTSKY